MKKKSKTAQAVDPENPPLPPEFFKRATMGRMHVKPTTRVELDPDVAKVFSTSQAVNSVLRGVIQGLSTGKKRKKSA